MRNMRIAYVSFRIPHFVSCLALLASFFNGDFGWAYVAATFTPLGDLPGGSFASYANGVSADGKVVVGYSFTDTGYEAFRWTTETGMVSLGGPNTNAASVSADGSVIVGFHKNGAEAMRWTVETGIVGLGHISQGSLASQAQGVSGDGTVIVGYNAYSFGHLEAFRWTAETGMVGIGYLGEGDIESSACCVSADGHVIAGSSGTQTTIQPFRWTADAGMIGLGDLPGGFSDGVSRGISADGRVIVGGSGSGKDQLRLEAFRWTSEAGMVGLGALGDDTHESVANDASADGSIIVGDNIAASFLRDEAFIWSENTGIQNLRELLVNDYGLGELLNGWALERAHAITPDGLTVVGFGRNARGQEEAWRVQFVVPEPGAAIGLMFLGFVVVVLRCRCRIRLSQR
jgi:probable HAF family extracellular repeat protein